MQNLTEENNDVMFGIPTDFPRIVDSVSDSLRDGYKDYCFSTKQLNDIKTICHNRKVTFLYKASYNNVGQLAYYMLVPGKVMCKEEVVENIQMDYQELPKKYKFKPNNSRVDNWMDANYKRKKRVPVGMEINYFDENGNAVLKEKSKRF